MTIRAAVLRGLLAGLLGGVAAGLFAFVVAEPHVDAAIEFEERGGHAHDHGAEHGDPEAPPVSRDQQKGLLFLATGLWGLGVGGIFGIVFAALRGRAGPVDGGLLALALCGVSVLAFVLVPALKYPPNPPGVGNPGTIGDRTAFYFLLLGLSLAALLGAWRASMRSARSLPASIRMGVGIVVYLGTIAAALALLPSFDEVPSDFPPQLLWDFRIAAIGTQLVLWSVLGMSFAALTETTVRSWLSSAVRRRRGGPAPGCAQSRD